MRIEGEVGEHNEKNDAADKRISRAIDTMSQIRDRLTILETKLDGHVRTTKPVR
jgi:hypothetical protein